MSEEQYFVTLGFETKESAKNAHDILKHIHQEPSEYKTVLPGIIEPEYFVDALCGSQLFGKVIMADWFGSELLRGISIAKNLKLLNPKYQSLEHYQDTGSSTRTGYIGDKKTNYRKVLDTLAEESDEVGYTLAILEEKSKNVKAFLDKGINPHASSFGRNVLLNVDYLSSGPLILALIEAGAYLNPINNDGKTPLIKSILSRRDKLTKAIIEAGADVNLSSPVNGATAAHYCIGTENENRKILKLLCKHGADLNIVDQEGYTPLLRLMDYHHSNSALETLKLCIKQGADIHYHNERSGNALWLATENDLPDCQEFLIEQGAELKKPAPSEPEPLPEDPEITKMLEFFHEHEKLTSVLLSEGPKSNIFWPDNDKVWLKQRRELWKYMENSIKQWFCGNIKSTAIKNLKKYFINGHPFSKEIQLEGLLPKIDFHRVFSKNDDLRGLGPLLLVWLHPSSDLELLKRLIPEDFEFRNVSYYLFPTQTSRKQLIGVAGPRLEILAQLFFPYCYSIDTKQYNEFDIQNFVYSYCSHVPAFLGWPKTPNNQTMYLFDNFINAINISIEQNITLKNESKKIDNKGKKNYTTTFKHMIDSVSSFNIDGIPFEKVKSARHFVALFEEKAKDEPLKTFIQEYG